MTPSSIFLLAAFVIVAVPVVLLRVSGLKSVLPLVVVQIIVGIALGPSVFGRIAPGALPIAGDPGNDFVALGACGDRRSDFWSDIRAPHRSGRLQWQGTGLLAHSGRQYRRPAGFRFIGRILDLEPSS